LSNYVISSPSPLKQYCPEEILNQVQNDTFGVQGKLYPLPSRKKKYKGTNSTQMNVNNDAEIHRKSEGVVKARFYKNTSSFTEFGPDFWISSVYSLITLANFWPSDAEIQDNLIRMATTN
jgi:hypothetical protein